MRYGVPCAANASLGGARLSCHTPLIGVKGRRAYFPEFIASRRHPAQMAWPMWALMRRSRVAYTALKLFHQARVCSCARLRERKTREHSHFQRECYTLSNNRWPLRRHTRDIHILNMAPSMLILPAFEVSRRAHHAFIAQEAKRTADFEAIHLLTRRQNMGRLLRTGLAGSMRCAGMSGGTTSPVLSGASRSGWRPTPRRGGSHP